MEYKSADSLEEKVDRDGEFLQMQTVIIAMVQHLRKNGILPMC